MFKKSNSSNKIASMLLSGGLMLGMAAGSVMAETISGSNGTIDQTTSGTVKGFYAASSVNTYSLTLSWGNMKFVYDKGYWNGSTRVRSSNVAGPEANHNSDDTGIWYGMDGTNNSVTITSNSNHSVDITASVAKPTTGDIATVLSNTTLTLTGGTTTWTGTATSTPETSTTTTIGVAPEIGDAPTTTLAVSVSNGDHPITDNTNNALETDLTQNGTVIGTITLNFVPTPAQQP